MNMATITAPREEARDKARTYRNASDRAPANDEYRDAAEVYELLAAGRMLINVGIAIRDGGFDQKMRPRLALARADRKQVYFSWESFSDTGYFDSRARRFRGDRVHDHLVESVNFNRRHNRVHSNGWGCTVQGYALVPMVPPECLITARRRGPGQLRDWHILWEVEQWSDKPLLAEPPVDPYLLRRVRGDLFEVLAQWDLTEVERMVMAGRARVEG